MVPLHIMRSHSFVAKARKQQSKNTKASSKCSPSATKKSRSDDHIDGIRCTTYAMTILRPFTRHPAASTSLPHAGPQKMSVMNEPQPHLLQNIIISHSLSHQAQSRPECDPPCCHCRRLTLICCDVLRNSL